MKLGIPLLFFVFFTNAVMAGTCMIEDPGPTQRKSKWEKSYISLRNGNLYFVKKFKDKYKTDSKSKILNFGENKLLHTMMIRKGSNHRTDRSILRVVKYEIDVKSSNECQIGNDIEIECQDELSGIESITINKFTKQSKTRRPGRFKLESSKAISDLSCLY